MPTVPSGGRPQPACAGPRAARASARRVSLLVLPLLGFLVACGGPDHSGASHAVEAFTQAVADDPDAACGLLSERTRTTLEADEEATCKEAITGVGLPDAAPVEKVDVYGGDARVITGTDVLFLARFPEGWKVMAAGCEPQGADQPHDCLVAGG